MNESLLNRILKDHKRRTRSLALILCLSMIVSLGTFAGFHKTAIAKVYTREVLDCPYAREGAEPVAHVHNDDCYEGETLVCTLPERAAHTHDDTCYAESRMLSCGLEENPGHQHSEECFDENGELICQIPEGEGAHVHTDDCYTIERALICNQPELPVHVHDAGCFRTEEITVDEPEETAASEQAVSTVPEMPVSDPNADLETADDWNREFENLELSGNWARDLVLVAATQQGRGESPNNFEAVLNDAGNAWVTHGYTRYGAWYGYPYAEWDAMFVSFCLRYAGIPEENVPNNPTAAFMAESFSMGELFAGRDYIPAAGDLIFFDTVDDEITNIDHMGIVYHVDTENGTINTVEGDRTDAVATFGYYLNDEQIVGYGILPQNPNYVPNEDENTDNTDEALDGLIFMTTDEEEPEETPATDEAPAPAVLMPAQSWERTAGGIKVTVEAPEGAFPENTQIAVTPVNGNSLKDTVSDAVDGAVLEVQAVDITFFDAEGHEIEPAVPLRVVMTPAATEHAEEKTSVVHVDIAQQTAELIEQAEGTEADNSEVVFDADAFTIYAIVYTVHFEYEVDGQVYTSTVPGAQDKPLSELIRELNVVEEEQLPDFITKIKEVSFSNPEVLTITETEGDWTIRPLKDSDQEEALTIVMQDGATFRIAVEAEGITEVSTEDETAVISTVGDFYLPEEATATAELLNEEQSGSVIAAVQQTVEAAGEQDPENAADAADAGTNYQAFSVALENVDVESYDGFNVSVTLPEDAVVGRDFQLYQVKEDGSATDLTESLTVTSAPNEDGLQNVSGISFKTEDFADFVLSYSIETYYTTAGGDTYRITLNYGPKAGIPDGAELKVQEILPEDEKYTEYYTKAVQAVSGTETSAQLTEESYARFFDIEIWAEEEKIEPKAPVNVTIQLTDAPEALEDQLRVVHFGENGPVVMPHMGNAQAEDGITEMRFETESFSVYGVIVEPAPASVNDLGGMAAKIQHGGRYLLDTTVNVSWIERISKGSATDAAVYYFEETETSGVYYISTGEGDTKKYINFERYSDDVAHVRLGTDPQPLTVNKFANGSYGISGTTNGRRYYINEFDGAGGQGFAGWWYGDTDNSYLSLDFQTPLLENDNDYMVLVKQEAADGATDWYIVLNDGKLAPVEYDEATGKVKVDNPMLWKYDRDHIYHHSKEVGFQGNNLPSDYYYKYIDPSSESGLNEDNENNTSRYYNDGPHVSNRQLWNSTRLTYANNLIKSANSDQYIGVNQDTTEIVGGVSQGAAAEIYLAKVTAVPESSNKYHTVNHIDISIKGGATLDKPLAYGDYYYYDELGVKQTLTVSPENNVTLHLKVDSIDIKPEDMKNSEITAYSEKSGVLNDAFYISGYSGNHENSVSTAQVRIEGSFKVSDLEPCENAHWQSSNYWDGEEVGVSQEQLNARLNNRIYYTVTVKKEVTFDWLYTYTDDQGVERTVQLYDSDNKQGSTTSLINLSKSFDYWDGIDSAHWNGIENAHDESGTLVWAGKNNPYSGNECPPIIEINPSRYIPMWEAGHIIFDTANNDGSGMDFKLEAHAAGDSDPAIEITKTLLTDTGEVLIPKSPVTNTFVVYQKRNCSQSDYDSVIDVGIGEGEVPAPGGLYNGYSGIHAKTVTVGQSGEGLVYDYDVKAGMTYIKEDENSIHQELVDKDGKRWRYVKTYIDTEYAWRQEGDEDKLHHVDGLISIPEAVGPYGDDLVNGFLPFYVYNVYERADETVTLPVEKSWSDFASSEYSWTAKFQLQYMERKISGDGEDTAVTKWTNYDPEKILTINKGNVNQWTVSSTFGDLPKYRIDENGNKYERQYSAEELSFTVWKNGVILYSYDGTSYYIADGADESIYKAFYDHDANEDWDGDWNLRISNSVAQKIEPRTIDIGLKKEWEPNVPDDASAKFVLRRYIQTEYVDYGETIDNPTIIVQLQDQNGNVLSSVETKSGMNVYIDATFAPDKTGTMTFQHGGNSYSVSNQTETGSKVTVRSAAIPVTGTEGETIVVTLTEGDLNNLIEGNTYNLRITDHLTGTDPVIDSDFSPTVEFPIHGATGTAAWQYTFEDLKAEDGEWNADGTLANFNIYSYYLEETAVNPSDGNRLSIVDSNGNTISSSNRIYNNDDVTATNRQIGAHIHVEKRWFRLVSDQMPPIVVKVTERDSAAVINKDAYDSNGNIVKYSEKYGGYILDRHNGWAIDLDGLAANVMRRFEEIGIIIDGDPSNGYADGHLADISVLTQLGYDTKHYYFNKDGTAPDESTHDKLVAMITDNGNVTSETSGTMFIYNVPEDAHYQLEVHKRWFSFNGQTGLADITSTYGAAEGNGFIMQIQQRARWRSGDNAGQIASDWVDYGQSFEVYKDHNTAVGFEEVIQGQEWLTTIQQRNVTRYGYAYNSATHEYDVVEYEYRLVEVGVIDGNDGRIWSKNTVSNTDPDSQADKHRYEIENFEVGKIQLQKYWNLEDQNNKASEVYFKIYSEWWFSSYGAEPGSNGLYDVAEIIGRDINDPSLSAAEKAQIQSYWLRDNITVKQVGSLGYVFAISGQGDQWSGLVRGLPLLVADPGKGGGNSFAEVEYTVAEVGAWYNGGLVKVGDSSWPYVEPLYYRNTRNQGLNRVDNGETFQIDNGTVNYQSFFRAINSDIPSWKFHAEKTWESVPEQGASVVLELQALRLTPEVLNSLTKTAVQETEGIKVSNLMQEQIQTLVALNTGWATAEIDNPSVVLPKSWDFASMPETTTEEIAAKNAAAAKAWSVDWAGLPMTWKNASVENSEEYELLYRVVETSSPSWTKYTIGDLTIGENYALSQTVHNEPEISTGDLTITKEWKKDNIASEWPDGYVINYKVIQHAYLATVEEDTTQSPKRVLVYHADTGKPIFDELNFTAYSATYGESQQATNGEITSAQNPVTLHGLPKGAVWTAPEDEEQITEEMKAAGIQPGKTYSIAYAYEIVETGVTSDSQPLPFTATSGSLDVNTVSEGSLENTLTDVKVQKNWKRDGSLVFDGEGMAVDDDRWPEGYTIGYKVIREIMMEKVVGEETESVKVGVVCVFTSNNTTALSDSNPSHTISNLPTAGYWTAVAPGENDAWKSSYDSMKLTAGESYAATFTYRVEEATTADEGSVAPEGSDFTFSAIKAVFDDVTKAYVITNDLTEVKVIKVWQGYTPQEGDKVGVKLYVSTTAPGDTEKVNVTTAMSWTSGTVAPDTFSVALTITGVDSKGDTVETRSITLDHSSPTITTAFEKYDDYDELITYSVTLGESTGEVTNPAISGNDAVSGNDGTVTITATGVAPKNTGSITIENVDFDGEIKITQTSGGGKNTSDWTTATLTNNTSAVLSGLTAGVEYYIQLAGFSRNNNVSNPTSAIEMNNATNHFTEWGNDNGYWITATDGDTKITLRTLQREKRDVPVTITWEDDVPEGSTVKVKVNNVEKTLTKTSGSNTSTDTFTGLYTDTNYDVTYTPDNGLEVKNQTSQINGGTNMIAATVGEKGISPATHIVEIRSNDGVVKYSSDDFSPGSKCVIIITRKWYWTADYTTNSDPALGSLGDGKTYTDGSNRTFRQEFLIPEEGLIFTIDKDQYNFVDLISCDISQVINSNGVMNLRNKSSLRSVTDTIPKLDMPVSLLAMATPKTYTGEVTTTTITLPDAAIASQNATVVGKAGLPHGAVCLTETEIELSAAEDSTTGAAWSHLWKDLPKTDADGNALYYYVVETSATVGGSTVKATYTRTEATETEPATITITNEVEKDQKYGSLKVTKELTGVTTDNWWTKSFKFTLRNSAGKYLKATSPYEWQNDTAGAEFTVSPSTAILFDQLPVGNYVITETSTGKDLSITAYEYDSTGSVTGTGDEGIIVSETNTSNSPATFNLVNNYTPKKTNVTVTKAWENADGSNTAPSGAKVIFKLYRNGAEESIGSITLDGTVDEDGEAAAWKASWTDLPMYDADEHEYTYTVKEVVDSNGYSWGAYVVNYPTDGTTQEHKTSASNGETITNTEKTTDLTVDKKWFADAAAAAAGTPEKEPTQATIYYKIMQKLGDREATVYTYNNAQVQSLTYNSTDKDWTAATHTGLPIKVYVPNSENPENSAWLNATYYVVECDSTGNALVNTDYDVTYQKNSGTAGSDATAAAISSTDTDRTITIINTDALIPVKIIKVDANTNDPLSAVLRITKKNSTSMYEVYPGTSEDEIGDEDGKFTVSDESGITFSLPAGEYKIEEITPPPGYVISSDSTFYFKVVNGAVQYTDENGTEITNDSERLVKHTAKTSTDPATFKVGNRPGTALPQTGGIGTTLFTALGGLMTATAGAILTIRRKRKPAES